MSVYKIVIGKDMAPQNKNTSHLKIDTGDGRFGLFRTKILPKYITD